MKIRPWMVGSCLLAGLALLALATRSLAGDSCKNAKDGPPITSPMRAAISASATA